jgi:very-short-patch-repair endonuclease
LGPYFADFWCAAAQLVVELDGPSHFDRKAQDRQRDAWMAERGIAVLRFTNFAIDDRLTEVVKEIERVCAVRTADPSPLPLSPLRGARGAKPGSK